MWVIVVVFGVIIGFDMMFVDCEVGEDVVVCCIDVMFVVIGVEVMVGLFLFFWLGMVLGVKGKIGVYVEMKNVEIGEGSKVLYLLYVGDVMIGCGVNFGVSIIIVNYDDVYKYCIEIGDEVYIGLYMVFVVFVRFGVGVKIGVGVVVCKDVLVGVLVMIVVF